jgi:hypothetical protein
MMRRALLLAGLFWAVLLAQGAPAWAADPQIAGKRVALVIGNGQYRNVDRLPNSTNDARLIARTLQSLGFTLVGGGPLVDLDRARMAQAVQDFGKALTGAEVGLFYYSGHGLQVQGVNWLVPVDANPARPQDLDFQMVDADLVLRQMDGAGTKLNLVLLDACRNNPFATRGLRAVQGGLAEMRAPEGTLISYATQPGNVAADGVGENSPYTTALANSIRQPGMDIFRVFNQVGLQVKRTTNGAQQPWVSSSPIDGEFFFSAPAPPVVTAAPTAPAVVPAAPAIVAAGLARPPQPAPAPVPTPVDPASRLLAMIQGMRCSSLETRSIGNRTELAGLTAAGPDLDRLQRQTETTRGVRVVGGGVDVLPPFACGPVELLGASVRQMRAAPGPRLFVLRQRAVSPGEPLSVTVHGIEDQAVLLDLYLPGGLVQHVPVRPEELRAGEVRITLPPPAGVPSGDRLLTLIVTAASLNVGVRPATDLARPYLDALRRALPADGVRAEMAVFELRSAPPPPVRVSAPAPGSRRCGAILERAQLGEALSDADRATLRGECR